MEARRDEPPLDPTTLFQAIVLKLHETRHGVHQRRMTQALLQRDASGSWLIGLAADTQRVVSFNPASRTLELIPFDWEGTYEERAEMLSRRLSDPSLWVEANATGLSWMHPYFRWVYGLGDAGRSRAGSRESTIRYHARP